jgi:HEAT repeat protein
LYNHLVQNKTIFLIIFALLAGCNPHPLTTSPTIDASLPSEINKITTTSTPQPTSTPNLEPLIADLNNADPAIQKMAANTLGEFKDTRAIEPLIEALASETRDVQDVMIWTLVIFQDLAVEPLIAALKNENPFVRSGAAQTLGIIADDRAIGPLMDTLKDIDPNVRAWSAEALGHFYDPIITDAILIALRDEDAHVRSIAANSLGFTAAGDPRALDPLISALKDENADVRWMAAQSLGYMFDNRAIEPLIEVLDDEDPTVRKSVLGSLLFIGEPAVEPLTVALDNEQGLQLVIDEYRSFFERGLPGTETILIKALFQLGNVFIAQDYLNCGNTQLEQAGAKWGNDHGYAVKRVPEGENKPVWVWGK